MAKVKRRSTNKVQVEAETTPPGAANGTTSAEAIDVESIEDASISGTATERQTMATRGSLRKRKFHDTVESDAFLEEWDMTIRRCQHCSRPFATAERLSKHHEEWSNGSCSMAEDGYEASSQTHDDRDIEDLVPGGDLIVNLDDGVVETTRRFRVSSQILSTASSCFQVSFGPRAQFASADDVRRAAIRGNCSAEIDLDDDPAAMKLVLNILCFRHHELPATLDFDMVLKLAIIADKYELDLVLRPSVTKWLEPFKTKGLQAERKLDDWLFIAWVFMYEDAFVEITRALTLVDSDLSHLCKQTPDLVLGTCIPASDHHLVLIAFVNADADYVSQINYERCGPCASRS